MNNVLKFSWEDRHRHFWSSDWHVFHNPSWDVPIWEMRGYENAQVAAEQILEKINSRVGENDVLWYLGDMFLNATDEMCLNWLSGLKCRNIKKMWGNHCSNMWRLYKEEVKKQYNLEGVEIYPLKMGNVEFIGGGAEIRIGKRNIIMNHFPFHSWNGMGGRKSWCLSGHSHNSDQSRNPDSPLNRCLDVGWDWKKDVWSFSEIEDVMSVKTFVPVDHHQKTTY